MYAHNNVTFWQKIPRGFSSVGRAFALHAKGHRFDSGILHMTTFLPLKSTFSIRFYYVLHDRAGFAFLKNYDVIFAWVHDWLPNFKPEDLIHSIPLRYTIITHSTPRELIKIRTRFSSATFFINLPFQPKGKFYPWKQYNDSQDAHAINTYIARMSRSTLYPCSNTLKQNYKPELYWKCSTDLVMMIDTHNKHWS